VVVHFTLCSFEIRNIIGNDDSRIRTKEYAAVSAKKASDAFDQIDVASVLNPIGANINVAGNSLDVKRNTSAKPDIMPGFRRGTVIDKNTFRPLLPKLRAASSRRGFICSNEDCKEPKDPGINKIKYAKINKVLV
tara:strand:+ start:247 stop:651 length:405 start_codon:yes stop_codon:yes gene_type:complete